MAIKVGINGFGRIGRLVFRRSLQLGGFDFVAQGHGKFVSQLGVGCRLLAIGEADSFGRPRTGRMYEPAQMINFR